MMFPDIQGQVENLLEQVHMEEPLCTEYRRKYHGCNVSLLTIDQTWLERSSYKDFDYVRYHDPLWRPGILFKKSNF